MNLFKKINWKAKLKYVLEAIKFYLFILMMTLGFFLVYAFIADVIGLELTNLVLWICLGLAAVSEFLYVKWISN